MGVYNSTLSALIVLSLSTLCKTQNNTKVQLDLLFPQNNTLYKPVYPFPIVFAIHNAALSWPFGTIFRWQLMEVGITEHPEYQEPVWNVIDDGGYKPAVTFYNPTAGRGALPLSPFLFINSSLNIINTTATRFRLQYTFGLWTNCSDEVAESQVNRTKALRTIKVDGEVTFNISRNNGKVPSIEAGECATPLGAIGILGSNGSEYGFPCPIRQNPPPETEECKFKADLAIAKEVADAMIRQSDCRGQSWPNVTGLLGPCHGKDSLRFGSLSGTTVGASLGKFAIFAGALGVAVLVL
jgi:hypothetical protein